MGVLQNSKNQAPLMTDSINAQDKGRHNGKEPKAFDSNYKESHNPSEGDLGSNKNKKFEKKKFPYCMRGFHPENHCVKNHID